MFTKAVAKEIPAGKSCCDNDGYINCRFEIETGDEYGICELTGQKLEAKEKYHLKCAGCPVPAEEEKKVDG